MGPKGDMGMKEERGEKGDRGSPGAARIRGEKERKGDKIVNDSLPSPCYPHNHRVLDETWRKVSQHRNTVGNHCNKKTGYYCNKHGSQPGWHRGSPTIGGAMPETCPTDSHCGTYIPGWLKGSHPTVIGQKVSQTVCFHYYNNCCQRQITVQVINCGSYYVYYLPNVPFCNMAYCGKAA